MSGASTLWIALDSKEKIRIRWTGEGSGGKRPSRRSEELEAILDRGRDEARVEKVPELRTMEVDKTGHEDFKIQPKIITHFTS